MSQVYEGLSIVMPAYNEEGCIADVCNDWVQLIDANSGGRLIVVNDGSKDKTGEILDRLAKADLRIKVVHQKNSGHGAALLNAYRQGLNTNSKWIFHVDSDNQFKSSDFQKLWDKRNSSSFILGFRKIRHDAFHRLVITRLLRLQNFLLFGVSIRDCNIPYRLIRADYLRKLLAELPGEPFAPNIFLAVLAKKAGQDLFEIEVEHAERNTGTVSIVRLRLIKACLRCVRELFELRCGLSTRVARIQAHGA